jgi:hypothetical protein
MIYLSHAFTDYRVLVPSKDTPFEPRMEASKLTSCILATLYSLRFSTLKFNMNIL